MDPRLEQILARQQAAGLAGLAGSEVSATIRLSDELLNEIIAAVLPASGPLRSVTLRSHTSNRMDVSLAIAKASFLPAIPLTLAIDRQPVFPADPVLELRIAGLAGGMMHFAGSFIGRLGALPPGVRLEGERIFVDLRVLTQQAGQGALLTHVRQLAIATEEGRVAVVVVARVT